MGIFGRKGAPSKAGAYSMAWPQESGLAGGAYDATAAEAYLIYTSERRAVENVPREDMPAMTQAHSLLYELAAGTPINETPLIQGPIDIKWINPAFGPVVMAVMVLTDRSVLVWWERIRGAGSSLVILHHIDLLPRADTARLNPYVWRGGIVTDYPVTNPPAAAHFETAMLTLGVHFTSDGHANRRSRSVISTMREVEDRVRAGIDFI